MGGSLVQRSPAAGAVQAGLRSERTDAGEMLDPQAKAAYRSRLVELREDLEEAEAFGDTERAARAKAEIEVVGEELSRAVGLGGRDRRAASAAERARVNVTRSLKSTITRIGDALPDLGRHLSDAVKTGTFCSYDPDPRTAPDWLR